MKYLLTFFAVTIIASSSAYACSEKSPASCKTEAQCKGLGPGFEYTPGKSVTCMVKINQTTSVCDVVNNKPPSMPKETGNAQVDTKPAGSDYQQ